MNDLLNLIQYFHKQSTFKVSERSLPLSQGLLNVCSVYEEEL